MNRRVGGLEMIHEAAIAWQKVNRRAGGLEKENIFLLTRNGAYHRIGGLKSVTFGVFFKRLGDNI